jgi:hypothetical protein
MKAQDINSTEDFLIYIEGCLNDFESAVSTKEETMNLFLDMVIRIHELAGVKIEVLRSTLDKILNIGKPVYSEDELLIINDSINRHMNKEIKDDSYISMKSNRLISKEEHEKEWKENVE